MPDHRAASAIGFAALSACLLALPLALRDTYQIDVGTRTLQALLLVMSLHLMLATGRLNLAHVAFAGIAAYVSAAMTMKLGWSVWLAAPVAIGAAALVSLLLALPILRLAGAYFFLVTFAFLNVFVLFFQSFFTDFFGGASGLIGVPGPDAIKLGGWSISFNTSTQLYYLSAVSLALLGALLLRLNHSRFGLISNAIRQSEKVSSALGINSFRHNVVAFVTASVIAAFVGTLFAHSQKVVQYNDFNIDAMLRLVVFVVVGGVSSIWGAIAGTLIISLLAEFLRGFQAYETLIYGFIIVCTMLFLPEGVGGAVHRLWSRWQG